MIARTSIFAAYLLSILSIGASCTAAPITYQESVTGSGSLAGVAFSNALLTISLPSDTSTIDFAQSGPTRVYFTVASPATFTLVGFGAGSFTGDVKAVAVTDITGIGNLVNLQTGSGIILATQNDAAFLLYALTPLPGPVAGVAMLTGDSFSTSLGALIITSASGPSTFTTIPLASTGVPEPSSLAMMGGGLVGVAVVASRRRHLFDRGSGRDGRGGRGSELG